MYLKSSSTLLSPTGVAKLQMLAVEILAKSNRIISLNEVEEAKTNIDTALEIVRDIQEIEHARESFHGQLIT